MYTDICSSLSHMRSMSCVLPLLVMGFKADTNRHLFVCTVSSAEEDECSNEPDQAGVSTKLLEVTRHISRHNHEAIRRVVVTGTNTCCEY